MRHPNLQLFDSNGKAEEPREQGIKRVELLEPTPGDNSVGGPFEFGALSVPFAILRYFEVADVR